MKIEIKNLTKKFGEKTIFEDYNLTIEDGEMVSIIGPSGCGKSTLLNIIGMLEDYQGEIYYGEIKFKKNKKKDFWSNYVSFLFQNYALVDNETVFDNLCISMPNVKRKDRKIKIQEILQKFNMEGLMHSKIHELSGGEQQRIALARIYLKDAKLILADEPTGNLDDLNSDFVFNELLNMAKQGKTVVIVTHDKKLAHVCDRVISL